MDEKYIQDLYNHLGGESKFGKYDDFKYLISTDTKYRKDFHSSFGDKQLGAYNDFDALVSEKKNQVGKPSQNGSPISAPSISTSNQEEKVKTPDFGMPSIRDLASQQRAVSDKTLMGVTNVNKSIEHVDNVVYGEQRKKDKDKRIQEAIKNTAIKYLKQKGIANPNPQQLDKQVRAGNVALQNGDVSWVRDKDGQLGLKHNLGFFESLSKAWDEASIANEDAHKFVNEFTPEQKVQYLKFQKEVGSDFFKEHEPTPFVGENKNVFGEFLGGQAPFLGKAALGYAVGSAAVALAPETLGASLSALPLATSFLYTAPDAINHGAMAEQVRRFHIIKHEHPDMDDVEVMKLAEQGKWAGGMEGLVTNAALTGTTLKMPLALQGKSMFGKYLSGIARSGIHLGGILGATKTATELEGNLEGVHTSPSDALKHGLKAAAEGATVGSMLHVITSLPQLPKLLKSGIKHDIVKSGVPPEEIQGVLKMNEDAGTIPEGTTDKVVKDLSDYKAALDKLPKGLSPEVETSVAGLIQKRDNLKKEAENLDESVQHIHKEEIDGINQQIADIVRTGKPLEHEVNEITGETYKQPQYDDIAEEKIIDVADKISKGKRLEDAEDVKAAQEFPEELQKELNKIIREEKSGNKDKEKPNTELSDNIEKYLKEIKPEKPASNIDEGKAQNQPAKAASDEGAAILGEEKTGSVSIGNEGNVTSFKTSKGSEYTIHEDGTTTRNKSFHAEHGGDEGIKPRSQRTIYVDTKDASKLSLMQTQGWEEGSYPHLSFDEATGRVAVGITGGKNDKTYDAASLINYTTKPEVGKTPIEIWENGKVVHFGNEIVDVATTSKEPKNTSTKPAIISPAEVKEIQGKEIVPLKEGDSGDKPPIEPPKENKVNDDFDGKKDLDKLANNIPDSGKVAEYMSKDTIEKYTGELPTNDQTRGIQELDIALNHGEKIIEKAQELFGKDYAEKTLDYIDNSSAGVSNKALMYVSLENALGREKLTNPERAAEITKQQALVYERSQAFARENSLALNYQKLRRIAQVGYDVSKVTDSFFSAEELQAKKDLSKAIESDGDAINKEAESHEAITPEIETLIKEGVEKEINSIYESLPENKKSAAARAIKALEEVQKKLRSRTYDATIGIPVAIIDAGITTIKHAIKLGVSIADAVEAGIKKIKELHGKEWKNEETFRKDALSEFDKQLPNTKKIVKDALIESGFGREINIKGEKKQVLDWKKLSGKFGTVEKIGENVEAVLKKKGMSVKEIEAIKKDLADEYVNLRTSIIEKSQNELAKRNKINVTPQQKAAARVLSELYTYGLFEKKAGDFEVAVNKALGAQISEQGFAEAKKIAEGLETLYSSSFKGIRLDNVSAKTAINKLEDRLRILLFNEAKKQGNFNLRAANIVRNYFEIQQTMVLNNLKQAVENPLSGLQQNIIDKISGSLSKEGLGTKEMAAQRRKAMKDVYKDMILHGGIGYGKIESTFVNRQHIDDYVNKLSDNKLYHGIASTLTGKTTLNTMDAMFKASITEKKFANNLLKILTHETNKNRMSKDDAVKFVSEKLTGQTFKDAQVTAKTIIDKINKDADSKLINDNVESVDRLANDIVKASLEMGGKITKDQISAAYNAAYKGAGLGLGHEANNILSSTIQGYSARLEGKVNQAIKDKEWNRAALLTLQSVLFRNLLNPFVGGGTNWLVLKVEKTGLGLVTGLGYQIASKSKIDVGTELGMKKLEERLYNQSRIKDNYMRGVIGGLTTGATYLAFVGIAGTDEYRRWRGRNMWAARYLDVVTPEPMLAKMAIDNKAVKRYVASSFNRNDAFDATTKAIKAADYAVRGKTNEAWGALGESVGAKFNVPVPWRLVKDGQVIYQGVTGQDPYHGDYKASTGFMNGVFQSGAIEWLGWRPSGNGATNTGGNKLSTPKQQKLKTIAH